MTLTDLYTTYYTIKETNPSYRLGQHFINLCIKDESDPLLNGLWEKDGVEAEEIILKVIDTYQWDCYNLPVVNEELLGWLL